MSKLPHRGMNLRDAIRLTLDLGGTVEPPRRTGELRFSHPHNAKPVLVNARRKDAPRSLTTWLTKLPLSNRAA